VVVWVETMVICDQLPHVWEAAYYKGNETGVFARRVTLTLAVWETEVTHYGRLCSLKVTCL
jgi:hypothetical protein